MDVTEPPNDRLAPRAAALLQGGARFTALPTNGGEVSEGSEIVVGKLQV
jgi:hypothetical protein